MQKHTGKLSKVLGMFYIVIVVGTTQLYTFVKMHQNVYLQLESFTVYKLSILIKLFGF